MKRLYRLLIRGPLSYVLATLLAFLVTPAWGLDVRATKTEAEVLNPSDSRELVIDLGFKALLMDVGDVTTVDVVATWQNAGGVDPQPFKVAIPAGCFVPVRDGIFRVAEPGRCGVEITMALGGVIVSMSIIDFDAQVVVVAEGSGTLDLNSLFGPTPDDGMPVLGALGGAVVEIVIGRESAISLPRSVESVSGIEPTPF